MSAVKTTEAGPAGERCTASVHHGGATTRLGRPARPSAATRPSRRAGTRTYPDTSRTVVANAAADHHSQRRCPRPAARYRLGGTHPPVGRVAGGTFDYTRPTANGHAVTSSIARPGSAEPEPTSRTASGV